MLVTLAPRTPLATRLLRVAGRLAAVAALTIGLIAVAGAGQAHADPSDPSCYVEKPGGGGLIYICGDSDSDENPGDGEGGDGSGEPSCDMSTVGSATNSWCEGENACWANIPSAVYPTPDTWPGEPPNPDAVYIFKVCYDREGNTVYSDWTWYTPQQPSLEELAWIAYGELNAPAFDLAFSPPGESVIHVDTWWWADGAPGGSITGSSAGGVIAVAEPDSLEVEPGDGSGTMTCAFVVSESDECTHTYERASRDGYPARARLVYDVHFERNGQVVEPQGLPDSFESAWEETSVPVTEVQANVVR
ncbi:hypothetical protein ACTWP5_04950 [Streptomyces sp. 4N509B]|uniref:hypothetical protein n=1 Tax=Streptomyces sp. 4N509B TaxID=3457413 RepID=UPI003FD04A4A